MTIRNTTKKNNANQKLLDARLQHSWTQQDVANKVGTTVVNVSRWERGVTSPGPYFRLKLCLLFEENEVNLGLSIMKNEPRNEDVMPVFVENDTPVAKFEQTPTAFAEYPLPVDSHRLPRISRPPLQFIILLVGSVLIVTLYLLISQVVLPLQAKRTQPPIRGGATHTTLASHPPYRYSFEDGGLDNWVKTGHILLLQNSTKVGGYDGTHALQVDFSSREITDLPYLSVNPPEVDRPQSGQTLSAALFVATEATTTVRASLYVQDATFGWHSSHYTPLIPGRWNILRFLIPSFVPPSTGPVLQVGIQLSSEPLNVVTTTYVDAVQW